MQRRRYDWVVPGVYVRLMWLELVGLAVGVYAFTVTPMELVVGLWALVSSVGAASDHQEVWAVALLVELGKDAREALELLRRVVLGARRLRRDSWHGVAPLGRSFSALSPLGDG